MKRLLIALLLLTQPLQAILIKNDPSTASGVANGDAITGTAVTNDANTSAYRVDDQAGTSAAPKVSVAAGVSLGGVSGWYFAPVLWETVWNTNSGAYTDGTLTAKFSNVATGAFGVRAQLVFRGDGTSSSGQPNSAYELAFYQGAGWDMIKTNASAAPTSLKNGTECSACSPPFTVKVGVTGTDIWGTINGTPIPTVTDNTFSSGYYGFTGLAENVSITSFTFDDGQPTPTPTPTNTPTPTPTNTPVSAEGPTETQTKDGAMLLRVSPTPVRSAYLRIP